MPRRLLLVHAHPDDESIGTGATIARYAAEGTQVTLVTCTRGELGEVIPTTSRHTGWPVWQFALPRARATGWPSSTPPRCRGRWRRRGACLRCSCPTAR